MSFFHGWRRKAGLATLLMACILMVVWMRSRIIFDCIHFPIGKRQITILSMEEEIHCWGLTDGCHRWRFETGDVSPKVSVDDIVGLVTDSKEYDSKDWYATYRSITIPLTVLSAWLILIPSRNDH
ncbi:MAG TPA: hypothetical protein VGM98_25825 [Schlesneria sp.]|jgi:hypothetical protein